MRTDFNSKNTETGGKQFIINIRSLSKKYGDHFAVNDLNLKVAEGEIFGFLGHNGAGKTTTVNMLTTLLQPTSGGAFVAGFDILRESVEVRKRIGYLPENVKLYDSMTAYENLEYFAKLSGISKPKERILLVLDFLDANGYRDKKIGALSKGMLQRIGIAQAILHESKLLFLDEPTSGLDPFGVKQLHSDSLANTMRRFSDESSLEQVYLTIEEGRNE